MNILEEIENYFSLNNNESIILTNLRIIYVYPNKTSRDKIDRADRDQNFYLHSIILNSIFFYSYEEKNSLSSLKIFYYDEKTEDNLIEYINYIKDGNSLRKRALTSDQESVIQNGIIFYNYKRKNNMCLKMLNIESKYKRNRNVLKNIYETFVAKNINKNLGVDYKSSNWNVKVNVKNY